MKDYSKIILREDMPTLEECHYDICKVQKQLEVATKALIEIATLPSYRMDETRLLAHNALEAME